MTMFWDRQNKPIEDTLDWARKFEDVVYRNVAIDIENQIMVSTIWQGFDLAHSLWVTDDTAMIFETAVLREGEVTDQFSWHSEQGALIGHDMVCQEVLGRRSQPQDGYLELVNTGEKRAL